MSNEMCRLCLKTDNLKPIFADINRCDKYTTALSLTTGLQINLNDGLPQVMCTDCTSKVNTALNLRNMAHQSKIYLLQRYHRTETNSSEQNFKNDNLLEDLFVTEEDLGDENKDLIDLDLDVSSMADVTNDTSQNDVGKDNAMSRKQKRELYLSLVDGAVDVNGPIKCKICKRSLNKWASFISHSKLHLGFKYVCEFCAKSFISSTQLNRHCRSHHGMKRELACPKCDYMALDNTQLTLHERRVHTGERPYVCDLCAASYFSRKCLVQHIESHSNVKTIQCEKCPQMFKSRRHLARHTYTSHTSRAYSYKCPVCNQVYRNLKYIRVHLKKLHGVSTKDVDIVKIKL